ncbi:hypothetical protein [Bradyrhizobium sp. CSS354]|uniref:hypothetical protein n=1 Tax=Bradyrhizobium sp. CSS354 TaxID=2699172 RepID=UPI0023B1F580|nr:hypothetical protein [Bradyrhizobium sp. CSS354]MDE5463879.1 hypothetical protein [Bradyrhizobium sp. CSS354]
MTPLIRLRVGVFLIQTMMGAPTEVSAGGVCILHPQPFKLRSDTVRWSMTLKSGAQCIQGLRWSTLMIDKIAIVEVPKSGRLVLGGPSFRYIADLIEKGSDHFALSISGSSLGANGTSVIEVEVKLE